MSPAQTDYILQQFRSEEQPTVRKGSRGDLMMMKKSLAG